MKLLVIGHYCMDVIHPPDGGEIPGHGGIYYTVAGLATLLGSEDTVIPVFGVNKSEYTALMESLSRFPNIDTSGIFKMDEPTNQVHLYYQNGATRTECSKFIAPPIPYQKIRRHLAVDGVLVNMISGSDIELDTLDHVRMAIRGHKIPMHFDYHSLTLGVKESFERFRRPLPDWRRWVFMTDIVQLNEEEIGGLTIENLTEPQTVGHLLTLGVKGVLVTRGAKGATLFHNEKKIVARNDIAGIPVDRPRDATGCGDIFGAAFFSHYVRSGDMLASATYANNIAARKAQLVGSDNLISLRKTVA